VPTYSAVVGIKLGSLANLRGCLQVIDIVPDDPITLSIVDQDSGLALVVRLALRLDRNVTTLWGFRPLGMLACALLSNFPLALGCLMFGDHIGHARGKGSCSKAAGTAIRESTPEAAIGIPVARPAAVPKTAALPSGVRFSHPEAIARQTAAAIIDNGRILISAKRLPDCLAH